MIFPWIRWSIFTDGVVPAGSDLNDGSEIASGGPVGVRESSVAAHFNGVDPGRDDADSQGSAPAESAESPIKLDPRPPGLDQKCSCGHESNGANTMR